MLSALARTAALALVAAPLTAQTPPGSATDVLERYVEAIGGRARFESLQSIESTASREGGNISATIRRVEDLRTKRVVTRIDSERGTIETGFDGQRVWQRRPDFSGVLPDTHRVAGNVIHRDPPLWEYRKSARTFVRAADETVDGERYAVVTSTARDVQGIDAPVKYYFDPSTWLLRRQVTTGDPSTVQKFSDYRDVDGRKFPFRTELTQGPGTFVTTTQKMTFNVPTPDSLFTFRAAGR